MATTTTKNEVTPGAILDGLVSSVGKNVRIETHDGIYRDGRLSGIGMRVIKVNGADLDWPADVELNGDPSDRVPFDRIASIRLA